jgi:hypothetical protein
LLENGDAYFRNIYHLIREMAINMSMSGISSLTNQTMCGRTESHSNKDGHSNSAGWKYVTITEGDTVYTYIVIGENMKILIGKAPAANDKDEDKDKTTADDKTNALGQNASNKMNADQATFLTDTRMLALTGNYQKKLREIMKNLEDHIGCAKVDEVETQSHGQVLGHN